MIGARFLVHRVSIVRQVTQTDGLGDAVLDDYGQPVSIGDTVASDVPAGIQPRGAREIAALHEAGAVVSDTRIYLQGVTVRTSDAIHHDPTSCPASPDLPAATYNVVSLRDAAGAGHHVELDARLVSNPLAAYATAASAGGYS